MYTMKHNDKYYAITVRHLCKYCHDVCECGHPNKEGSNHDLGCYELFRFIEKLTVLDEHFDDFMVVMLMKYMDVGLTDDEYDDFDPCEESYTSYTFDTAGNIVKFYQKNIKTIQKYKRHINNLIQNLYTCGVLKIYHEFEDYSYSNCFELDYSYLGTKVNLIEVDKIYSNYVYYREAGYDNEEEGSFNIYYSIRQRYIEDVLKSPQKDKEKLNAIEKYIDTNNKLRKQASYHVIFE